MIAGEKTVREFLRVETMKKLILILLVVMTLTGCGKTALWITSEFLPAKAHLLKLPDRVCQPERPSHTLCKPPMWCIIEAPHRRFYYRRGAFSTVRSVSAQCQEPPVFRKKTGGFGRSVIIGFQKTQIYQRFAGSRKEVFILKI